MNQKLAENFEMVKQLYNEDMSDNVEIHDLVYPGVFGEQEYIGQFSDNSASELREMALRMALHANAKVLDVGCGRGRIAKYLANCMQWDVTGIDIASVPLSVADGNAKFVNGNIYQYRFDCKFDGAYGTGSFCHFDAANLFACLHSILKPGARLGFMERICLSAIPGNQWDRLTSEWYCPSVYSTEEYRSLLEEAGFVEVEIVDLTPSFKKWQERSVSERQRLKTEIVTRTSQDYYETSVRLAANENDAAQAGYLGYAMIVATRNDEGKIDECN